MFTLHYDDRAGTPIEGEWQRMSNARRAALAAASRENMAVLIYANERPRLRVNPDGSGGVPTGMETEPRETHAAGPGACFCTACREARRRARP